MMHSSPSSHEKNPPPNNQLFSPYLNRIDSPLIHPTYILSLADAYQVESARKLNPLAESFGTDFISGRRTEANNVSLSSLDPLADCFEPNHLADANLDTSSLSVSSNTGILNPSVSIFIPISEVLQGNCIIQSQIHGDESEDVHDITPCIFDTETPDLSMYEDEILPSNSTGVSNTLTFLTMQEFGAYAFIYMISLMIIGILSRSSTSVSFSKPSLLGENDTASGNDVRSIVDIDINETDDPKSLLQKLKAKNSDRPVIAHININFLNPKYEPLKDIIKDNVDILLVSETKLDDTFPDGQFFIEGYKEPVRLDRNKNGGGLLFFIHDDLNSKEIKSHKLTKKQKESSLN